MQTRKTIFKIFCLGMILLQLNCMFLKENESRCNGNMRLTSPEWKDSCAIGATEVDEHGQPIGAANGMATNATTEETPEEGTEAANTEGAEDADEATEDTGMEATNATETTDTTSNATLRQSRPASCRATSAQRRAARKLAREARRSGAKKEKTLRQTRQKTQRRTTLRQTPVATEEATNATNAEQPAEEEETTDAEEEPVQEETDQPAQATKGGALNEKLQELIGSIKDTQDVTIQQLDELKNSDLINAAGINTIINGKTGRRETAPAATNETAADMETPTEEEATDAAGSDETAGQDSNATATLRAGSDKVQAGSEIVQDTVDGPRFNRPECPCKLKRRMERKLRRESRKQLRQENNKRDDQSCMIQKQWDLIENLKVNAPTIANAISDACTVAKAKASEGSTAQGLSETNGSQTATSNGSGNSISVANAVGNTKSLTDSKAMKKSNSLGVTQSTSTGNADSNAIDGSISIANAKNTNMNTNELCSNDGSTAIGRTNTNSEGTATSNASNKSLASANALDKATAQSKLIAEEDSINVGNTEVASNAKATSTAANQSKAQTVSESTGEGNTDMKATKNSRAVGNLELTSASDTTADAINGGNALGTAESKTCGSNEGAADNNSTVILNNKNANTATSNSKSSGTLEGADTNNATEEVPAGTRLQSGRRPLRQTINQTTQDQADETTQNQADTTEAGEKSDMGEGFADMDMGSCFDEENVQDICSLGMNDVCGTDINAAKDTETDMDTETETEEQTTETNGANANNQTTNGATLKSGKASKKGINLRSSDTTESACGSSSRSLKTQSSCDMPLGKGIFRGDAHTKNICRNMCQKLNLPRVTRAEIKSGSDNLTIFRCLCGDQYTSWFRPNYPTSSNETPKLTRSEKRKLARRAARKSLRQSRTKTETCGTDMTPMNGEATEDRATLRSQRRTEREGKRTTLRSDREDMDMGNGCAITRPTLTAKVDMKPVVDNFIVNNANNIKAQSANYLNKVQDLLASKTGSSNGSNGVC